MDSHKQRRSALEEQEQERLRQKKKEWRVRQERERKHEERKLKMIEEYEKKRTEEIKRQKWQSKNSSLQGRETSPPDNKGNSKEQKASVIINGPEGIIDEEELKKIKINIYKESHLLKSQSTLNKIERDIVDPDDIILPRRQNEGERPIFQRSKIKTKEIRSITYSQNEQVSEKQLSTGRKNVYTHGRSDDDTTQRHCSNKSTIRRDDQTIDDDRYCDRRRSSSMRNNKEKDRDRSPRRDRSSSRYNSDSTHLTRNRSTSRYRSRSRSPANNQTKERKVDNDRNKFTSRRNYPDFPDRSRELNNFSGNNFYNPYNPVYLPGPMPRPSMFMPIFPYPFPMNIHRWQQLPPNKVRPVRPVRPWQNWNSYSIDKNKYMYKRSHLLEKDNGKKH